MNVNIVMCQFVPNFLGYVSVKYYLNWFSTKIERVNFLLEHSVVYSMEQMSSTGILYFK